MSSVVSKSKRVKRKARTKLSDFNVNERKAIDAAKQNFGSPVVVFGSRARGNWAADSDIDIGVTGYNERHHKSIAAHMSKFAGIKVDLFKFENALTHKGAITL